MMVCCLGDFFFNFAKSGVLGFLVLNAKKDSRVAVSGGCEFMLSYFKLKISKSV